LRAAAKKHGTKALAPMLQALLSYPDSCVLYPEYIQIAGRGGTLEIIEAPVIELEEGGLLPKEFELVRLAETEKAEGRKVLCYLTYTGTRDIRPRLVKVLQGAGFHVGVLDASVDPRKREAWIRKHSDNMDILLVNAELVKTGLDLYAFPTVVFHQVGYNIFTLRQAARRSWRIGQKQPVRVYFFCYGKTMQEMALSLIARKLEVALIVEGDLPEGLAEYAAGGESLVEELGKALVDGGDYRGAEVAWANFRRKEIEAQAGISDSEPALFPGLSKTLVRKPDVMQWPVDDDLVVKVSISEGRKKRQSVVDVRYGDLDALLQGRPAQFVLF